MKAVTLLSVAAVVACTGCYWSSPPTHPYRHDELEPAALPPLGEAMVPALRGTSILVLGRFENVAPQPTGGLYDAQNYSISPIYRTYFFRDGHLELFEHACDTLRAAGLDVRRDYATQGDPALAEARVKKLNPLFVQGVVTKLQHDQYRTEGPPSTDHEIARLVVRIQVKDATGKKRYEREHLVEGRIGAAESADLLRTLGHALGASLARDPAFLAAVGAS